MKFKVKKPPKKKRENTPASRRVRNRANLKWITNKHMTGDLDLTKKSHNIMARIAVSKGLIPKEVFDGEE